MRREKLPVFSVVFVMFAMLAFWLISRPIEDNEPAAIVAARVEHGTDGLKEEGYHDITMGKKVDGIDRCGNFKHAMRYEATLPDGTKDTGVFCTND
jgi:hypothetical protein